MSMTLTSPYLLGKCPCPLDLGAYILSFLEDDTDLVRMRQVCSAWKNLIDGQSYPAFEEEWKKRFHQRFHLTQLPNESKTWREAFFTVWQNWHKGNCQLKEVNLLRSHSHLANVKYRSDIELEEYSNYHLYFSPSKKALFRVNLDNYKLSQTYNVYNTKCYTYATSPSWLVAAVEGNPHPILYLFNKHTGTLKHQWILSTLEDIRVLACHEHVVACLTSFSFFAFHIGTKQEIANKMMPDYRDGSLNILNEKTFLLEDSTHKPCLVHLKDKEITISELIPRLEMEASISNEIADFQPLHAIDDQRLAILNRSSLQVWDVVPGYHGTAHKVSEISLTEFKYCQSLTVAIHKHLAATCHYHKEKGNLIRIWNLQTHKCLFELNIQEKITNLSLNGCQLAAYNQIYACILHFYKKQNEVIVQISRPKIPPQHTPKTPENCQGKCRIITAVITCAIIVVGIAGVIWKKFHSIKEF